MTCLYFFVVIRVSEVIEIMDIFLQKFFNTNFINFLCVIGAWAFSCWCYENFKSLFQIIFNLLTPIFLPHENKSLVEKYGKWAGENKNYFHVVLIQTHFVNFTCLSTDKKCQFIFLLFYEVYSSKVIHIKGRIVNLKLKIPLFKILIIQKM